MNKFKIILIAMAFVSLFVLQFMILTGNTGTSSAATFI